MYRPTPLAAATRSALLAGALTLLAGNAFAWPDKPVQLLVGFPPGGVIDVLARSAAESLAKSLGQPVVIVNKDGAGGTIAASQVAKAAPDGYTIAFSTIGPLNLQPHLNKALPYKAMELVGICQAFFNDQVMAVSAKSGFKTLADVVAAARKDPQRISYGIPGHGTTSHVAALQLAQSAGVTMQAIAYKGDPAVVLALKSDEIEVGLMALGSAMAQGLKVVAVLAPERAKEAPDVPTAKEAGFAVSARVYGGLYGPRGMDAAVRAKLESACKAAVASERFEAAAKSVQANAVFRAGTAFDETIQQTSKENLEIIKATGLSLAN